MPESERKTLTCPFAFAKDATAEGRFRGHAAVFGNKDLQNDVIVHGAFARTIRETDGRWPILMGHNMGRVVGFSTGAVEDDKGLAVEGEFTLESDEGRNAYATVKHAATLGQRFGLSIGYTVRKNGADYDEASGVRTLKDLSVLEFSLAAVPANPRARVTGVKDAGDWTIREFEEFLRDSGFSKDQACAIASRGFVLPGRRDAGGEDECAAREFMSAITRERFLLR